MPGEAPAARFTKAHTCVHVHTHTHTHTGPYKEAAPSWACTPPAMFPTPTPDQTQLSPTAASTLQGLYSASREHVK